MPDDNLLSFPSFSVIGPLKTWRITVNFLPFLIKNLIAQLGVSLLPLICLAYSFSHSFPHLLPVHFSLNAALQRSPPVDPLPCSPGRAHLLHPYRYWPPSVRSQQTPSHSEGSTLYVSCRAVPPAGQRALKILRVRSSRNTGGGGGRERDPEVSLPPASCSTTVTRVWMLSGSWLPGQDGALRAGLGVAAACRP